MLKWSVQQINELRLAYIALGSNLGDSLSTLRKAATALEKLGKIHQRSSLYDTSPVGGPAGQANYLNAVIALLPNKPYASAQDLLDKLLTIEKDFGRERHARWDARTLDLDLLAFGETIIKEDGLELPHPRMLERAFVLAPLFEIAPDWQHPITKQVIKEVMLEFDLKEVIKTDFSWDFEETI